VSPSVRAGRTNGFYPTLLWEAISFFEGGEIHTHPTPLFKWFQCVRKDGLLRLHRRPLTSDQTRRLKSRIVRISLPFLEEPDRNGGNRMMYIRDF